MKRSALAEKLFLEEISVAGKRLQKAIRGLSVGVFIKMIRNQLGMSQATLAKRVRVPQAMLSRIEQGKQKPNLLTLVKIFDALSCDLVIAPILRDSIEAVKTKQAQKIAERHSNYLRGTMSLEKQEPDSLMMKALKEEDIEELLHSPKKLWNEENE